MLVDFDCQLYSSMGRGIPCKLDQNILQLMGLLSNLVVVLFLLSQFLVALDGPVDVVGGSEEDDGVLEAGYGLSLCFEVGELVG